MKLKIHYYLMNKPYFCIFYEFQLVEASNKIVDDYYQVRLKEIQLIFTYKFF